jgi:diketogulonate reductase-like aldo/keto reductase
MTSRRDFMRLAGGAAIVASMPVSAQQPPLLPQREIPGTNEALSIIGLGNSQAFRNGDAKVAGELLQLYVERGGRYVDVGGSSAGFVGQLGKEMGAIEQLFFANYIDPAEASAMRNEVTDLAAAQGKAALDLVHTRDLEGFRLQHDAYREMQEDGLVRFIGVARTGKPNYGSIEQLIRDGLVDFIQVNYSMLEPEAAESLLPLAMEEGIAVAISRPFMNGNYFSVVEGHELPGWAAEFDCESWAQFSLKYILAHPAVTCVLTETANPEHAIDNFGAGFGRLPDAQTRQRMQDHLRALSAPR